MVDSVFPDILVDKVYQRSILLQTSPAGALDSPAVPTPFLKDANPGFLWRTLPVCRVETLSTLAIHLRTGLSSDIGDPASPSAPPMTIGTAGHCSSLGICTEACHKLSTRPRTSETPDAPSCGWTVTWTRPEPVRLSA